MRTSQQKGRQLKKTIRELLLQENFEGGLANIAAIPARKAVNPLFSFFCSGDEILKWRSVTAMGEVVDRLAETDIESARVIMRRLMWHLNDESGGIGWGCPEAMGEIMARNEKMAHEFWCILISYVRPDGNFLEHETLQKGLLWGIGRLAHARPKILKDSGQYLHPFMQAEDPHLRGLAAWAAGPLCNQSTEALLKKLTDDTARISIYIDQQLMSFSVAELATAAMEKRK